MRGPDCAAECRDKTTFEVLGGAAVVPEGTDGRSTDASAELKQVNDDVDEQADVEEVEATTVALSIIAEAGNTEPLSRGPGCTAKLKVEPHTELAIAVDDGKDSVDGTVVL